MLGPNGVGKSTLVQAILGVLPLSEGDVRVLDRPADGPMGGSVTCPSAAASTAGLRVRGRDIVRLGLDGHAGAFRCPLVAGAAGAASSGRAGAGGHRSRRRQAYADRPIGELSGGEQQRLLIAQALGPCPGPAAARRATRQPRPAEPGRGRRTYRPDLPGAKGWRW